MALPAWNRAILNPRSNEQLFSDHRIHLVFFLQYQYILPKRFAHKNFVLVC